MTRTTGVEPAVIQAVADEYEDTVKRYMSYQDGLYASGKLQGFEKKYYLQRIRQSLLWKLLLDDVIEGLPAFQRDPQTELAAAVAEATGAEPGMVKEEMKRVIDLQALVPTQTPQGTRYAWSE